MPTHHASRVIRLALLGIVTGLPASLWAQESAQPAAIAPLADRLAAFESKLDAARKDNHIPGLAVAIVLDDKVIYTKGLGVRDTDTSTPVDAHTVFAIGSSSKAFTSALLAMLIDDGKIPSWDASAHDFVPQLTLKDPVANEKITIRDLLCHRVGLMRTDLCWYGLSATPGGGGPNAINTIFAAVAKAEPVAEFRKQWNYSNPMFLAAGLAAARAASQDGTPTDWHTLIQSRIFLPLGMTSTSTNLHELLDSENFAKGYEWDEDTKYLIAKPPRDLFAIAPAGAINSNVTDMAQWLRLQLGKGTIDGKALITPQRIDEMWTKQIDFPGGGYGLGWMIHDFNGTRYVEHGGNIDGYAAEVAMFPDKHAGVVLLTNVSGTPLQTTIGPMVWDTLFPSPPDPNALPSEQLQELTGSYAFEQLKVTCKVLVKDGKLHIDVPGQTTYELKWPDADGKWVFALTDTIKLDFERAPADKAGDSSAPAKGKVLAVRLYQAGMTFRMPKEGIEQPPEAAGPFTRDQLAVFEGTYHFAPRNEDWVVRVEKGKLGADVPKQRFYTLKWPDDKGLWKPDLIPNATLEFVKEGDKVVALNFVQAGQTFRCAKTAEAQPLPKLDDILATRASTLSLEKFKALGVITLSGSVDLLNQGITGDVIHTFDASGRMKQTLAFAAADGSSLGAIVSAFDGATCSTKMMSSTVETLHGKNAAEQARSGLGFVLNDPRTMYAKVEVAGTETIDGTLAVVLSCTPKEDSTPETLWLSQATGLTIKQKTAATAGAGMRVDVTLTYTDYQPLEGVPLPMKCGMESMLLGKATITYSQAKAHQPDSDASFRVGKSGY